MKNKIRIYFFIILLYQLIISYPSHVKSASIEDLRKNTKNTSLSDSATSAIRDKYIKLVDSSVTEDFTIMHPVSYLDYGNDRFRLRQVGGHFLVKRKSDGYSYDSSGGKNGTIAQKHLDCLLHSTNNFFILEQIGEEKDHNGKLYYPNFSYRMAENLNMYLIFIF